MSELYAFLHPETIKEEKEVIISNRFKDESGKVIPFRIRALTQEENDAITRKSYRKVRGENGQMTKEFDYITYRKKLALVGTVFPDFSKTELCEAYGTLSPEDVIGKMLRTGEFANLIEAISELSGFSAYPEDEVVQEAKN